jgi:hypothetical protein
MMTLMKALSLPACTLVAVARGQAQRFSSRARQPATACRAAAIAFERAQTADKDSARQPLQAGVSGATLGFASLCRGEAHLIQFSRPAQKPSRKRAAAPASTWSRFRSRWMHVERAVLKLM